MSNVIGKRAIVVGAGMGGLTAARVLADYFEQVLILERDVLPSDADARSGVPQGRHVHALLAGGQRALCELFPGLDDDLNRTGAVELRVGLDLRMERPGFDPFPQRDLGFSSYAQSRPQLELCVRQRVLSYPNIELQTQCRVRHFVARTDGRAVTGLQCTYGNGTAITHEADLILDASGRGGLTLDLLSAIGHAQPEETTIGVDLCYATTIFEIPDQPPNDWKAAMTMAQGSENPRAGLLMPMEDNRWIVSLGGQKGCEPPGDAEGFMAFAEQLRTPTIYRAISQAKRLSEVARFQFNESAYRHYEQLDTFPRGLLPLGDAFCRFNPIYGQGMSVAAQEARLLSRLLASRSDDPDPLDGLATAFFAEIGGILETPWTMSAVPDLANPKTRGERPPNLDQLLQRGRAMAKLAACDPEVHKLTAEVASLLKPRSVYQDPDLMARVEAMMAESAS